MSEKEKVVRIKSIELKEFEELEPLLVLVKNPDLIEEGMKILANLMAFEIYGIEQTAIETYLNPTVEKMIYYQ